MRVDARLEEICSYRRETIDVSKADASTYISTENMHPNKGGIGLATSIPLKGNVSCYHPGDTLISNIRPYFKKIWYATTDGSCSNDILVLQPNSGCLNEYLYYLLSDDRFFEYATATAKGTKMPRGDKTAIMNYAINQIDIDQQKAIVAALKPIQTKISLNNRINDYLAA